jgi:hypothetical protein
MASLNLSQNGPSISASYQKIVNSPPPSSAAAANSPTYGQWAVFAVQAPLANAFQPDPSKESVLKVQSTGEGELIDMIEDFSDGKIQFAFVKVKDTNSGLPKNVLVCWCGEGVPERTKGYFTSHMNAVSKLLHGYHVQITARSDQDLTPEGIVRKVADSSGSKYGGGSGDAPAPSSSGPRPPVASKPAMPTKSFGAAGSYSMGGRSRAPAPAAKVDADGWGEDAPPVSRSQLEKVGSAYQPTKVNMAALQSGPDASRSKGPDSAPSDPNVVRGGYQPIGKVDINAIRKQAQSVQDDRPTTVKGAYEPIGKVDIADIRRKAQGSSAAPSQPTPPPAPAAEEDEKPKSLAERSAAFTASERLTSLPKPKVANRFGANTSSFAGTKAPTPGGFEAKPVATAAPIGAAGRTFADSAGKTPAQQWAEKKARERGNSGAAETLSPAVTGGVASAASPIQSQQSGSGWQSSYAGKKWGVQIPTRTGGSGISEQKTGQDEPEIPQQQEPENETPSGIGSIRDRFKEAPPMGAAREVPRAPEPSAPSPPPLDTASKPNASASRGVPIPGMPPPPPRPQPEEDEDEDDFAPPPPARPQFAGHPTQEHVNLPPPPPRPMPESDDEDDVPQGSGSPVAIARPVARGASPAPLEKADTFSPPPAMPTAAIEKAIAQTQPVEPEPQMEDNDPARGAGQAVAAASYGADAGDAHAGPDNQGGHEAIAQFDYEKAEENELELREGERVYNIDMVDEDWWMGENSRGEKGLFPSNYVELVEGGGDASAPAAAAAPPSPVQETAAAPQPAPPAAAATAGGKTATAQYDYQAAEDNELSFPDGGKITGIVSLPNLQFKSTSVPILTVHYRNSPTTTGGSATSAANPVCSLPTTSSSTRKSHVRLLRTGKIVVRVN